MRSNTSLSRSWPAAHAQIALGALALAVGCGAPGDDPEGDAVTRTADIVGGGNAIPGGHPWIARLFITEPDTVNNCGGTLIARDWVLTAAHCVDGVQPGAIFMWLGEYDTSSFDGFEQPNFVDEIHINPGYNSDVPPVGPRHNDMALLKLHTPATLNSRVATIPLASAVVSSGTGIAAGWGQTGPTEEEQASTILQRVSLPIRSASACNSAEIGSIRTLKSDELCAGASDGSVGACHGDSGGPFIRAKAGGGFELIGVTSWGALACTSYSVFNRVSSQLSWIRTFVP